MKNLMKLAIFIFAWSMFIQTEILPLEALASSFEVTETGDNYVEVEFILNDYEIVTNRIDKTEYQRIFHPEAVLLMEEGLPELPVFSFSLAVPNRGEVSLQEVKVIDSKTISNIRVFPSQGPDLEIDDKKGFVKNSGFYHKDTVYPNAIGQISEPATMRDYRFISVAVTPLRYNPAQKKLEVNSKIRFRVEYDESIPGINELDNPPAKLSRSFENLYRSIFLNFEEIRDHSRGYQARSILVIYHHNETIEPIVGQYIDWKRRKGFEVHGVNTNNLTNHHEIKAYIQNAYDNWTSPPEYVVIIGSAEGNLMVPIVWQGSYQGDHPYTLLEGNDNISDVFIGRISVTDASQLMTIWNKIRNYEINPYVYETDWYEHVLLGGAENSWGISTVYTNKYIKEIMLQNNSDYSFTEVYNPPFSQPINNALNEGTHFFHYRSFYGAMDWDSRDMATGFKLPNSIFISCDTYSRAVAMVRRGTPTTPNGGISAIGMASSGTSTGPNNALSGGIAYGIFKDNMRTMGEALVRGKVNLHQVYGIVHPNIPPNFSHWANLVGDPSLDIWVEKPKEMNVSYEQELPTGSNSLVVNVEDGNGTPLRDAWVTLRKGEDLIFATDYTDANGSVTLFFDSANKVGEVDLTVTKPDYIPHLGEFNLLSQPAVVFEQIIWDEEPIAGNSVDFIILAENHRQESVDDVSGVIHTDCEYISITSSSSFFGDFTPNEVKDSADQFQIEISPDTPAGYKTIFLLTLTDDSGASWDSRFLIEVQNGNLTPISLIVNGVENGVINPDSQIDLSINLQNSGQRDLEDIYGKLKSNYGLAVVDSIAYFGNILAGGTVNNSSDNFVISTSEHLIPGMVPKLELHLYNDSGFNQKRLIDMPIGIVTLDDPIGPDSYGYRAYDSGDTGYPYPVEYDWIEIVPHLGGYGISLGIEADTNDLQDVTTIDLPFRFQFYGEEYEEISVCANGWMSFGHTEQGTARNWRLPGPLGPDAMVAAFWDNIRVSSGSDGVFTYHDMEEHLFIIQWNNTRTMLGNAENTFQIILYDPMYYPTNTGDGPIKIQYKVFNNNNASASGHGPGNYATIGIADHTGLVGLEYSFGNVYPQGARPLQDEMAIYFTTSAPYEPFVTFDSYSIVDSEDNKAPYGELSHLDVSLTNQGNEAAHNVTAHLSTENEYVTIIDNYSEFGSVGVNETSVSTSPLAIQLADNTPYNVPIKFTLDIQADNNISWKEFFYVYVRAPHLSTMTPIVYDPEPEGNDDGVIDPGETVTLYLPIKNVGNFNSESFNIEVEIITDFVQLNSISRTEFEGVKIGETVYPALNISVHESLPVSTSVIIAYTIESGNYVFMGHSFVGLGGKVYSHIGTGGYNNSSTQANPINIYNRSLRSQMVYRAEELRNAGYYGNEPIVKFGFFVVSLPNHPLPNFVVRMRNTEAEDGSNHDQGPFTTVYSSESYSPNPGGWDMLTLDVSFIWNGTDNLLIDTAFDLAQSWDSSGRQRIYHQPKGYRYVGSDSRDQTNAQTLHISEYKPQIMLAVDTVVGIENLANPLNLSADLVGTEIELNWEEPVPPSRRNKGKSTGLISAQNYAASERNFTRNLLGYNIYRNGVQLNESIIEDTEYLDTEIEEDREYYYYVTALYEEGESRPSNVENILVSFITAIPEIYPEAGVYYEPFEIALSTSTLDASIYYTLDGSEPTEESHHYVEPFQIERHTLVRAKADKEGLQESEMISAHYYLLLPVRNLTGEGFDNLAALEWDAPWQDEESSRTGSIFSRHSDNSLNRETVNYNIYWAKGEGEFILLNEEPVEERMYHDENIEPGNYQYYVKAQYEQGESYASEAVEIIVGGVSVDDKYSLAYETELLRAYPNPFNPETSIAFSLKETEFVTINIYNISGKLVRRLVDEQYASGRHRVLWQGDNDYGRRISSGIYLYKMQTENYQKVKKIILLK